MHCFFRDGPRGIHTPPPAPLTTPPPFLLLPCQSKIQNSHPLMGERDVPSMGFPTPTTPPLHKVLVIASVPHSPPPPLKLFPLNLTEYLSLSLSLSTEYNLASRTCGLQSKVAKRLSVPRSFH